MKIILLLLTTLFSSAFNAKLAVFPSLISSESYGMRWGNYSLKTAGDVRPLHPLSALQLFPQKREPGWLTATYRNDKSKPRYIIPERAGDVKNIASAYCQQNLLR